MKKPKNKKTEKKTHTLHLGYYQTAQGCCRVEGSNLGAEWSVTISLSNVIKLQLELVTLVADTFEVAYQVMQIICTSMILLYIPSSSLEQPLMQHTCCLSCN